MDEPHSRRLLEIASQHGCLLVVLSQPAEVVLQRVDRARGDDTRLPHGSAEPFAVVARLLHKVPRAGKSGPDRSSQSFGEAHGDRVGGSGVHSETNAGGYMGVPDASSIEMYPDPMSMCHRGHVLHALERPDGAAAPVVGVLHLHRSGAGEMLRHGPDGALHALPGQHSVLPRHRTKL